MIHILFKPGNRSISIEQGITLLEAAARAGLIISTPCGGAATCGKCRVRFVENPPAPIAADLQRLTEKDLDAGWRLACSCRLLHDAVIKIPETVLLGKSHRIQIESGISRTRQTNSTARKIYLKLSPPALHENCADLIRTEAGLKRQGAIAEDTALEAPLGVLRELGGALRKAGFEGTATLRRNRLLHFEPGNTSEHLYGAAFDIGTTTLVGALLHLGTGEEKAVTAAMNPQTAYGDDVLSRIAFASQSAASLRELQECLLVRLRFMLGELCGKAGVNPQHVYEVVFAGNTAMQHLLLGLSPAALGMVPFVPTFGRGIRLDSDEFALGINPAAEIRVFPVIDGFVGGDTVSGILAADLCAQQGPILMLDIGTNGEIVLACQGGLLAASTAAGPAFEGARISCGMRAAEGAIEKAAIDEDLRLGIIGEDTPSGICESGLIDLCGQMLKAGLLQSNGRMASTREMNPNLPERLKNRLRDDPNGVPEFVFYESPEKTLTLTQQDVREVQLGAGAIRAGIAILLKQANMVPSDLKRVYIAGGFGSFIRRDNAQRLGLIPPDIPHEHIHFVGNMAFIGAQYALLSTDAWAEAERIARTARHVELSLDPDFAQEFALAMQFPER